jgi:hypothetical protein
MIVGARLRVGELDVGEAGQAEHEGGIDDRLLNVVDRHFGEARLGVEGAGLDLGVLQLAGGGAHAFFLRHAPGAGHGEIVRRRRMPAVVYDLAAVGLGLEMEDAVAKLLRRVL